MPVTDIRPSYYKRCSPIGRALLGDAFGRSEYDQECLALIDKIEAGFDLGNALKYLWRLGVKGAPDDDMKKAAFYLRRYCDRHHDPAMDEVLTRLNNQLSLYSLVAVSEG